MLSKIKEYGPVFWQLLKTDLTIYSKNVRNSFINTTVWFGTFVVVVTYIFPQMGMMSTYGAFIAISAVASLPFWDIWTTTSLFVADLDGNRTLTYPLTLPLPNWMVLMRNVLYYAVRACVLALMVLPLGKLFLFWRLDLSQASWPKFALILVSSSMFIGAFSLFFSSLVKGMHAIENIAIRLLFPIWFFGGTQFSWQTCYAASKPIAYLSRINPLLYASEGIRAALLGQQGNLPYWQCVGVLWLTIVLFSWLSVVRLKKRLDFV